MKLRNLFFLIATNCFLFTNSYSQTPSLTLHVNQPEATVSPTLYGLMTEEINHSYDGGLYGELIRNRIFKDSKTEPEGWSLVQDDPSAKVSMKLIGAEEHVPNDERRNAINGAHASLLEAHCRKD